MNPKVKVTILIVMSLALIFLWDWPGLLPFKVFVVYLHEISHAIAAILTGGEVRNIAVQWDQSGFVDSLGGNIMIIAAAGYTGSILWGGLMLYSAMKGRFVRTVSIIIAVILLFFTFFGSSAGISDTGRMPTYVSGVFWGVSFMITALMYPKINHFFLFFMGGLTSMYALYDLQDFFGGQIMQTDAGILANYYLQGSAVAKPFAYAIAIFISVISLWIMYRLVMASLHEPQAESEEGEMPSGIDMSQMNGVDPQMMAFLQEWQQRQELMKEIDEFKNDK